MGPLSIEAASLDELDKTLRELRSVGAWSAVKGAVREYEETPVARVEQVTTTDNDDPPWSVDEALPGATVISDSPITDDTDTRKGIYDLQAEADAINRHNAGVVERERALKNGVPDPSLPKWEVKQTPPKCKTCGAPTTFISTTGLNGPWKGYLCSSGNRDHTQFL